MANHVSYLQINHEFNESLAVMYFVHGYRPYGTGSRISWKLVSFVNDKRNLTDKQIWQYEHTGPKKDRDKYDAAVERMLCSYHQGYEDSKCMWTTLRCHAEWHYEILHCQHSSMLGPQPSLSMLGCVCVCVAYLKLRHAASLRVMWILLGFRL